MKKKLIPLKLVNIFNDKKIKFTLVEYLDYLNSKSLSENTIKNYFRDLIEYFEYLKLNNLSPRKSIEPNHIRKMLSYIIEKNFKSASVSRKITAIKSYITF